MRIRMAFLGPRAFNCHLAEFIYLPKAVPERLYLGAN